MPKPKQHQEKADRNRAFLDSIAATAPVDWVATVAFYCAVHLVEKLRAYDNEHSTSHEDRSAAIRRKYRRIQVPFHQLYEISRLGRYGTVGQFTMTSEQVKKILIDKYLVQIENFAAAESARRTTPKMDHG